jgi:purine-nucleoside phosphorylase
MSTPHINAQPGDFADVALLPGDPQRAEHIAMTFLAEARRVTDVRNAYGYTGLYQGHRVSVMAHGMGIPSCSIYATELATHFGVKTLIRVGSCGALAPAIRLGDVIVALGASTDSKVNRTRFLGHDFAALADFGLVECAVKAAREREVPVRVGNVFSSDFFYSPEQDALNERLQKLGVLAIEMEAAGLYGLAAEYGVRALAILTVSDHLARREHMSSEERRTSFDSMIQVALETAIAG